MVDGGRNPNPDRYFPPFWLEIAREWPKNDSTAPNHGLVGKH